MRASRNETGGRVMSDAKTNDVVIQRYLEGSATADELARLDAVLRSQPAARRDFAELLNLDSALAIAAADWAAEKEHPVPLRETPSAPFPVGGFRHKTAGWLALAAALVLGLGGAWRWQRATTVCATVASEVGAAGLSRGATLQREFVELKFGAVELITARGARVVIEAPAAFQFESGQRLRVSHGRVAAHVPPVAKGFT